MAWSGKIKTCHSLVSLNCSTCLIILPPFPYSTCQGISLASYYSVSFSYYKSVTGFGGKGKGGDSPGRVERSQVSKGDVQFPHMLGTYPATHGMFHFHVKLL